MAVLTDEAGFHIKPDSEVHQVQTWTRFYKKLKPRVAALDSTNLRCLKKTRDL